MTLQAIVISNGPQTYAVYITSLNADNILNDLRSEMFVGYQFQADIYSQAVKGPSQGDANTGIRCNYKNNISY